jgi:hypothetical protein
VRSPGATINVLVKGGTNTVHVGGQYEFYLMLPVIPK